MYRDMYQEKRNGRFHLWRYKVYRVCLLGMMCFVLAGLEMTAGFVPPAYASGPGGNVADPVVKAVDIAEPAVVRIITSAVAQLTVNFSNGTAVTFPTTAQNGVDGYQFSVSGTGTFISAHGNILTADHVVNPTPDVAQQLASQDVANYINQHQPAQQVSATDVLNALLTGQLASTPHYSQVKSTALLSTSFSGPINATSFQNLPGTQGAVVDQIVKQTSFTTTDTAIIHVSGMDNMPMVQLGDATTVQPQDQLTIIGFPGNGDLNGDPTGLLTVSINQIFVSAIKPNGGSTVIQVGGNVEHGDSGGPALNSAGQVVGIVSFGRPASDGGETSFLQTTATAKQMIQQAGIDTTPSAFQKAWNQAFNDYASTAPGHWHQAMSEFQQLASQYPQFKAISPFLQYATQQAQSETTTPANNPIVSGSGGLNPVPLLIGGLVVLVIVVFGWSIFATSARKKRKFALPGVAVTPPVGGYGTLPAAAPYPGTPGQSYGTLPANTPGATQAQIGRFPPAPVPQTPFHPTQPAQPQMSSSAPQPAFRPQAPLSAPQPAFRPQAPAQPPAGGMAAFGAPSMPGSLPVTPQASVSSVSQWRIWPCGHTNRFDASFCGTCGESAPPAPIVRRLEQ